MGGRHPPGYHKRYYQQHRERMIAQISENRRKRKRERRERMVAAGLFPLPPERAAELQRIGYRRGLIRRILASLPDVYSEIPPVTHEENCEAEGNGLRPPGAEEGR